MIAKSCLTAWREELATLRQERIVEKLTEELFQLKAKSDESTMRALTAMMGGNAKMIATSCLTVDVAKRIAANVSGRWIYPARVRHRGPSSCFFSSQGKNVLDSTKRCQWAFRSGAALPPAEGAISASNCSGGFLALRLQGSGGYPTPPDSA